MWIYFQQPTRITEAAHTLRSVYPERSSDTCSALLLQFLSSIPTGRTFPRRELNSPGFTPLIRVGELLLSTQTQTHTVGFASPWFTHRSVCFYLNGVLPLFCWCDTSDTHTHKGTRPWPGLVSDAWKRKREVYLLRDYTRN